MNSDDESEVAKFARLVEDSTRPLYPSCDSKHTCLSITLQLLKIKATHNWPNTSLDEMLYYLAKVFLKENLLPPSTYGAKKVVFFHGLEV